MLRIARSGSTSSQRSFTCKLASRNCFMLDTMFLDHDGKPVAAKDLAVDSYVLGADHNMVKVTWHQIYARTFCGIVDFCTRITKMVVTDSHPMPSGHGEVKEAGSLKKGSDLSDSGRGIFHLVSTLGSHFSNSGPPWETMGGSKMDMRWSRTRFVSILE